MDESLREDLRIIAQLIQELAEKNGNLYISMAHCEESDRTSATVLVNGKYKNVYSNDIFSEDGDI